MAPNRPRASTGARGKTLNIVQGRSQVSSSPDTSPMMSVTSSSPSSSSAMKVESSSSSSSMVSSISISSSDSGTTALTLPLFSSASASSSDTNSSASAGSGVSAAAQPAQSAQPRRYRAKSPDSCSGHRTSYPSSGKYVWFRDRIWPRVESW